MFPFIYNKRIIIPKNGVKNVDSIKILMAFNKQFDNPKYLKPNTLTFDNFNDLFKRHQWLDSGELKIFDKDNYIFAHITLNFFTAPVIVFFATIMLVFMNIVDSYSS